MVCWLFHESIQLFSFFPVFYLRFLRFLRTESRISRNIMLFRLKLSEFFIYSFRYSIFVENSILRWGFFCMKSDSIVQKWRKGGVFWWSRVLGWTIHTYPITIWINFPNLPLRHLNHFYPSLIPIQKYNEQPITFVLSLL